MLQGFGIGDSGFATAEARDFAWTQFVRQSRLFTESRIPNPESLRLQP